MPTLFVSRRTSAPVGQISPRLSPSVSMRVPSPAVVLVELTSAVSSGMSWQKWHTHRLANSISRVSIGIGLKGDRGNRPAGRSAARAVPTVPLYTQVHTRTRDPGREHWHTRGMHAGAALAPYMELGEVQTFQTASSPASPRPNAYRHQTKTAPSSSLGKWDVLRTIRQTKHCSGYAGLASYIGTHSSTCTCCIMLNSIRLAL